MSSSRSALLLVGLALAAPPALAQCAERFQAFEGTGLVSSGLALFAGEEGGIVVSGLPSSHFPIAVVAIGVGWIGEPNSGGSLHVYRPGDPRAYDEPLHSAPAPVLGPGLNRIPLPRPLVLTAQPFVVTYRHGPATLPGAGVMGLDGHAPRADAHVARLVFRPGPAWIGAPGKWVMWIEYLPAPAGTAFCFGDGSAGNCPCGPLWNGAPGRGCGHSHGPGAALHASGGASLSADTLSLGARGLPPSTPALFFQYASAGAPAAFGDGLLCSGGGPLTRLGVALATPGGEACLGSNTGRSLSRLADLPTAGGTLHYQAWYRDPLPSCTPDAFNLSSAVRLTWMP